MTDTSLHLTREETRTLDVDGEFVSVIEWEVHGAISEREFLPILERPAGANVVHVADDGNNITVQRKPCRVILPMFRYDQATGCAEGQTDPVTLDEMMVAIIRSTRSDEFAEYRTANSSLEERFVHVHLFLDGYEGHMMGCVPGFDTMLYHFMVRANLVRP